MWPQARPKASGNECYMYLALASVRAIIFEFVSSFVLWVNLIVVANSLESETVDFAQLKYSIKSRSVHL